MVLRYFIVNTANKIKGNKKLYPKVVTQAVTRKVGPLTFPLHGFLKVGESFVRRNAKDIVNKVKSGLAEVRLGSFDGELVPLETLEAMLPTVGNIHGAPKEEPATPVEAPQAPPKPAEELPEEPTEKEVPTGDAFDKLVEEPEAEPVEDTSDQEEEASEPEVEVEELPEGEWEDLAVEVDEEEDEGPDYDSMTKKQLIKAILEATDKHTKTELSRMNKAALIGLLEE